MNSSQALRARPFYFNKVFVNPKDENDVWVTELAFHQSTDGGKTFVNVAEPHGDNHIVWINPDNPKIMIETNDGGANITQDGARSWSSQFNQPTAEMYHVDADEQFPYLVYGPQQDTGRNLGVWQLPPTSWGPDDPRQLWVPLPGCESGQVRPIPSGKIVYGDCKGEFARMNMSTGQQQEYWVNPQQRYGKNPKEMMFRFVRQSPIEIDAHNPNVVYHGSQFVHKTVDGGVHWTKFSPDVTANGPEGQVTSGEPITRDMTGEEVYAALYSMRSSRLEPGVFWTGSNDGPVWVTKDNGKTWKNVTPRDLPPGGRVHTIEDSPHRKGSAYVSVYRMYLNDFKPYLYMTNDYGAHWTLLTDGANGIPSNQPMHVVREDPEQEGLLYAGTLEGAYVSFDQGKHWQSLQRNLPATPVTDIKVHHGDLVVSTMGRSFWIMDNVSPLRQLAASVTKSTRPRTTDSPARAGGPEGRVGQVAQPLALQRRRRARVDADRCRGLERQACRAGPADEDCRGPCGGARGDQAVRRIERVPLHARAGVSHALLGVGRPSRCAGVPTGGRADRLLPRQRFRRGEARDSGRDRCDRPQLFQHRDRVRAGGTRRRPAWRRAAIRVADESRNEPLRLGSSLRRWTAVERRRHGGRRIWRRRADGAAGHLQSAAHGGRLDEDRTDRREDRSARGERRYHRGGPCRADEARSQGSRSAGRSAPACDARAAGHPGETRRPDQAPGRAGPSRHEGRSVQDQMFIDQLSNVGREIGQADQKVGASAFERFNQLLKEWTAIKADAEAALR